LLNRLLSNCLEFFVIIKIYLGTPKTSLCLQPLYLKKNLVTWQRVEVTLTRILRKFIITSTMPTENSAEIPDISHS